MSTKKSPISQGALKSSDSSAANVKHVCNNNIVSTRISHIPHGAIKSSDSLALSHSADPPKVSLSCHSNVSSNLPHIEDASVFFNNSIPSLKCIAWNINGLTDKLGYPHILNLLVQFDLIFISESWLDKNAKDDPDIEILGYSAKNYPRTHIHAKAYRSSGGLLLYVKKNISNENA